MIEDVNDFRLIDCLRAFAWILIQGCSMQNFPYLRLITQLHQEILTFFSSLKNTHREKAP